MSVPPSVDRRTTGFFAAIVVVVEEVAGAEVDVGAEVLAEVLADWAVDLGAPSGLVFEIWLVLRTPLAWPDGCPLSATAT